MPDKKHPALHKSISLCSDLSLEVDQMQDDNETWLDCILQSLEMLGLQECTKELLTHSNHPVEGREQLWHCNGKWITWIWGMSCWRRHITRFIRKLPRSMPARPGCPGCQTKPITSIVPTQITCISPNWLHQFPISSMALFLNMQEQNKWQVALIFQVSCECLGTWVKSKANQEDEQQLCHL